MKAKIMILSVGACVAACLAGEVQMKEDTVVLPT